MIGSHTPVRSASPLLARRERRSGFVLALVLLVAASAAWRVSVAASVPELTREDPRGLLRTDPAFLYYVTQRIVDGGGLPPADFHADPRIEWPLSTDIPAMFTVGQELLVAWAFLGLGGSVPLHVVALHLMIAIASLAVVGVAGLARELTGSRAWGLLAGALWLVTAGSYRTPGYILVREDLSYPLFALHLYLLARALRVRSVTSIALAALTAGLALATWHAMTFLFTVEVACVFLFFLRTGANPFRERAALLFPVLLAALALLIPVLRSKLFVLSLPMQMLAVMVAMERGPAATRLRALPVAARSLAAVAGLGLVALACAGAQRTLAPDAGDYTHVVGMMLAKLRHLGRLPADPSLLPYEVRLLWQGIFETSRPGQIAYFLGVLALLAPLGVWAGAGPWWRRSDRGSAIAVFTAFAAACLILSILVQRLIALSALVLPVLAVLALRSPLFARPRVAWVAAALAAQLALSLSVDSTAALRLWYQPRLVDELGATLRHIGETLDGSGAVASDIVTSSAVLAHTDHPVVLQPKYETRRSRLRIERFVQGLYHESPEAFARILREEFRARYLLVHASFLWAGRYEAGLRRDAPTPPPGSAAYELLRSERSRFGAVPGFRLLYTSAAQRPRYRLYELVDAAPGG